MLIKHPNARTNPIPAQAYDQPIALLEYSTYLKKWSLFAYADIKNAWVHWDEVKDRKPAMLLNFGNFLATNDQRKVA